MHNCMSYNAQCVHLAVSQHSADEGHSSDIEAQASLDGDENDNQMGARERGGGGVTQG